jgi:hypothetical protein
MMATGDTHQIPPIEKHNGDIKRYLMKLGMNIFPCVVTLHEIKRFKDPADKALLMGIKKDFFEDSIDGIMQTVLAKFPTVTLDTIPDRAKVITYYGTTRKRVNKAIHTKLHGTNEFFTGLKLTFNVNTRRFGTGKLIKNFQYEITEMCPKGGAKLCESGSKTSFIVSELQLKNWFTYTHAHTCHSVQGATYEDTPIVICDTNGKYVTREWLWVALTRGTRMDNVYILRSPPPTPLTDAELEQRIKAHAVEDTLKGRGVCNLTVQWVKSQLEKQPECAVCHEPLELTKKLSIDRKDSDLAHTMTNCQLVCRTCNCSKKTTLL